MDKADKKQISRHTSICISSFFPHIFPSHSLTEAHNLVSPSHTNTQRSTPVYSACRLARTKTLTQVSECADKLHQCVRSLTCDIKPILHKMISEEGSLQNILNWIEKIMETMKIRLLNTRQTKSDWLEPHMHAHARVHGCFFLLKYA